MNRADELTEAGVMLMKGFVLTGYLAVITFLVWFAVHPYSLAAWMRALPPEAIALIFLLALFMAGISAPLFLMASVATKERQQGRGGYVE